MKSMSSECIIDRNSRSHHVAQLDPLAVLGAGGQIAGGIAPAGADVGVVRVLVRTVPHHLAVDPRDVVVGRDRLEHAGLDVLTPSGLLPQVEGRGDAPHQRRGGGVTDALSDDVVGARPGVLVGEHHHSPGLGGHHPVVSLVLRVGAAGTEAGQRGVDQRRMTVTEGVVVNAQPLGDAGAEVLDDHVGMLRQGLGVSLALGGLEVEDDAPLAAVPLEGAWGVSELFAAGRLDLDDLGAEVRHHHGGDAAGPAAGEVEDGYSIEDL